MLNKKKVAFLIPLLLSTLAYSDAPSVPTSSPLSVPTKVQISNKSDKKVNYEIFAVRAPIDSSSVPSYVSSKSSMDNLSLEAHKSITSEISPQDLVQINTKAVAGMEIRIKLPDGKMEKCDVLPMGKTHTVSFVDSEDGNKVKCRILR